MLALNLTVVLPDGSIQHPLAGTAVLAGATVQTSVNFTVPANQSSPAIATFRLAWNDTAGNNYGTESATVTTTLGSQAPLITDFNPKAGPAGTAVSITGKNLVVSPGITTVNFTGPNNTLVAAKINFSSAAQLAVVVPESAVTGVIQVSNTAGTAITPVPFTVGPKQDFQVTVAPSTGILQQGSSTAFVIALTSPQTTFTQLATLTVTGLQQGVAAAFTPTQITAGASSSLGIALSATNLQPGSYSFTVHAVATIDGKQQERTTNGTLNVVPAGQTTLTGQVLSTANEPIVGASVSLDGQTVLTDPQAVSFFPQWKPVRIAHSALMAIRHPLLTQPSR